MEKQNEQIDKQIFKYIYSKSPGAYAKIKGGEEYPDIKGIVEFYQLQNGVIVIADVEDLPKTQTNIFAFHIHDGTSCDDNFTQSGSHYNPKNLPHPQHAGDMPPLFANNGNAWQVFYTERINIKEILGKVVILHDNVDDFTSQPAGNSGNKIACGVIEKTN